MPMLDIFNDNAFGVTSLTDAVNNIPFVPGRCGQVIDWNERGITTLSVAIEQIDGVLQLLNPSPRGGPGETKAKNKRNLRSLVVPHYQYDDGFNADEVMGVRAFGSESEVQSVMSLVNQRQTDAVNLVLDPTLEYQRLGAVKGIILNQDGSTLYNLFTEFGVSQAATIDFNLDASTDTGAIRKTCAGAVRTIANNLGGTPFTGVWALCGDNFFDSLIANIEVRNTYKNTDMAQVLRDGYLQPNGNKVYGVFEFGGIVFENYRGAIGNTPMVGVDEVRIFPVGVPGLFRTVYAPADYMETVNTVGLPRYSRQYMNPNGKRIEFEAQSNPLSYCTRPKVLLQGTTT